MIKTMYNITKLITKRYVAHGAYMILNDSNTYMYFNERRIVICLYMSLVDLKKLSIKLMYIMAN